MRSYSKGWSNRHDDDDDIAEFPFSLGPPPLGARQK